MALEWDEAKRNRTLADRGVDFADVALVDWTTALTAQDTRADDAERRFVTMAPINDRLCVCLVLAGRSDPRHQPSQSERQRKAALCKSPSSPLTAKLENLMRPFSRGPSEDGRRCQTLPRNVASISCSTLILSRVCRTSKTPALSLTASFAKSLACSRNQSRCRSTPSTRTVGDGGNGQGAGVTAPDFSKRGFIWIYSDLRVYGTWFTGT
jgi:uncharacterized DUF497 family protein